MTGGKSEILCTPLTLFVLAFLFNNLAEASSEWPRVVILKAPSLKDYSKTSSSKLKLADRKNFRTLARNEHNSILSKVKGLGGESTKLYDFTDLARGFSAVLTDAEVQTLEKRSDVLFVARDGPVKALSIRTPNFLGLTNSTSGLWKKTKGSNAVIGIIDTGIWPDSASFSDKGYGPVPKKFKGSCNVGKDFAFKCNKKLVGAKYFGSGFAARKKKTLTALAKSCPDYASPRDALGHGTHVSSIAAGAAAAVNIHGSYYGTSKGMAPSARIAMYKVLWCDGDGVQSDVAKAIEAAVSDGVDVLSLSLGFSQEYSGNSTQSIISYFAYKATIAGVPVVFAGGNDGPNYFTVGNAEPWSMTVAAGTVDQVFVSTILFGSGTVLKGLAFKNVGTPYYSTKKYHLLISSTEATAKGSDVTKSSTCATGSLDPAKIKGRIVICSGGFSATKTAIEAVRKGNGAGVIIYLMDDDAFIPEFYTFPVAVLAGRDASTLFGYLNSVTSPKAIIYPSKAEGGASKVEAPFVSFFSSAGPSGGSMNLLKPDIMAPGDQILGAWSKSPLADGGPSEWKVESGTSMACPAVAGVIALLKDIHPTWTPSMLFSAIMTTSSLLTNRKRVIQVNQDNGVADPFYMGAGHINPNAAASPGLVYPISTAGYKKFLCSPDAKLSSKFSLFKPSVYCAKYPSTRVVDMNAPSVTFYNAKAKKTVSTRRVLRNVGPAGTYSLLLTPPKGVTIVVRPTKLTFKAGQTLSYNISVTPNVASSSIWEATVTEGDGSSPSRYLVKYWTFGRISWYNNMGHKARINVAVNAV